jgi:type IV secretory pathway VirB4 component
MYVYVVWYHCHYNDYDQSYSESKPKKCFYDKNDAYRYAMKKNISQEYCGSNLKLSNKENGEVKGLIESWLEEEVWEELENIESYKEQLEFLEKHINDSKERKEGLQTHGIYKVIELEIKESESESESESSESSSDDGYCRECQDEKCYCNCRSLGRWV